MNTKTTSVSFGRARLPQGLAGQFMGLKRGLRGRTVAFIILAHTHERTTAELSAVLERPVSARPSRFKWRRLVCPVFECRRKAGQSKRRSFLIHFASTYIH